MYNTLKAMIAVPSISGREGGICAAIRKMIEPFVDAVEVDALGNLIAHKVGTGENKKKILLCAHMDEIGFMVNFIEDNGYIRVSNIGGISFVASAFSPVVFENGARGVLVPEGHMEKLSDFKADRFYIDIGAKDKKDAEKRVSIGDFAVVAPTMTRLAHKRVAGRPFDDRIGCAILLKIAEALGACENDIDFVFSVQEEVGCRGAKTAGYALMPDYTLVFDVTGTGDTIGCTPMAVKLGDGAAIKIKDASVICHTEVVEKLTALAKANKIAHQFELLTYGGTDTSSIQTAGVGVKAGALSIPSRYIHSGVEVVDLGDAEACVKLALAFVRDCK